MQDEKFLHAAVMIVPPRLTDTRTHRQLLTGYTISSAIWAKNLMVHGQLLTAFTDN